MDYALNKSIDRFPVATPEGDMPVLEFLNSEHSAGLGVFILHKGFILFEHYARMQEYEKPICWSVTKVFASNG
ncbi:hypothetical protein OAL10_09270 [Gammaproteobacteria bacterium]|nr:hypothetical protein [Gammaproteobacteria bacterium]